MNKISLKDLLELEVIAGAGYRYNYDRLIASLSEKDNNGDSGLKRRLRLLRDLNRAVDRIEKELIEEIEKDLENGLTKS